MGGASATVILLLWAPIVNGEGLGEYRSAVSTPNPNARRTRLAFVEPEPVPRPHANSRGGRFGWDDLVKLSVSSRRRTLLAWTDKARSRSGIPGKGSKTIALPLISGFVSWALASLQPRPAGETVGECLPEVGIAYQDRLRSTHMEHVISLTSHPAGELLCNASYFSRYSWTNATTVAWLHVSGETLRWSPVSG